jgi:peptide deformylase
MSDPLTLELVYWPHPVLRRKAEPVGQDEFTPELAATAEAMVRIMHEHRGIGLAAPQVALSRRLAICCRDENPGSEIVLVNPRIRERDGVQVAEEGCLSFPGITGKVRRAEWVSVEAQDLEGTPFVVEGEGILGRCLQHEIDHLDGLVFTLKMTPGSRVQARRQLQELERRWAPHYGVQPSALA